MLVRAVLISLLLATLVIAGLAVYRDDGGLALYTVPLLLALTLLYVFRPQLEWALMRKNPTDLDEELVRMFETRLPPWYESLDPQARKMLRERTALLETGFEFRVQSAEDRELPGDLAAILISQAARLSLGTDILVPLPFETIVIYRHPFPSPQFPHDFHHSEIFTEDGVLMFSLPIAIPGVMESRTYFNIVLYEFARVFEEVGSGGELIGAALPPWPEAVAAVVGADPTWVSGAVGLPDIDALAVATVLFLDFPEAFAKTYPELDRELRRRYRWPLVTRSATSPLPH